jgi:manganese oxidase
MLNMRRRISRPMKKAGHSFIGVTIWAMLIATLWYSLIPALAAAQALDFDGAPPAGDPSVFTGPFIGMGFAGNILDTLPPANAGSFLGGPSGTFKDAGINNVLPAALQPAANVPTGGFPSPLFGAQPFTEKLLLFEEFGRELLDSATPAPAMSFPRPTAGRLPEQDPGDIATSAPAGAALEAFLAQPGISPFPARLSDTRDLNPWKSDIEAFLGRPLKILLPKDGRGEKAGPTKGGTNFYPRSSSRPPKQAPA